MKRKSLIGLILMCLAVLSFSMSGCSGGGNSSAPIGGGSPPGGGGGGGATSSAAFTVTDPSTGATINVPAGAYDASSSQPKITVSKSSTLPAGATALPANSAQGDVYTLTKDYGNNFLQPVEVTVPYDPNKTALPVVLYWDDTNKQYVSAGITNIDTTNNTVTFSTVHFSSFVVAGYSGIHTKASSLAAVDTQFSPGTDGFFVPNFGTYAAPAGSALGMSDFALWYFKYMKAADHNKLLNNTPGLYNKYREGDPNNPQDDVTAKALIAGAQSASSQIWSTRWNSANFKLNQQTTGLVMLANMWLTNTPQKLIMRAYDANKKLVSAQVVLAYKYVPDATNSLKGIFYLYDPNFPGEQVTISWDFATGFFGYNKSAVFSYAFTEFATDGLSSTASHGQFKKLFDIAENNQSLGAISVTAPALVNGTATTQLTSSTLPDVTVTGSVAAPTGGTLPTYLVYSVNGGTPTVLSLNGANFSFKLAGSSLAANNTVRLVTTSDLRDPWNISAFAQFALNFVGQSVASFVNPGFETGDITGWTVETHTWHDNVRDTTGSPFATISATPDPNVAAAYRSVKDQYGNYYSKTGSANPNYNPNWGKVASFTTTNTVSPGKSLVVGSADMIVGTYNTSTTAGVDPIFDYYLKHTDANTTSLTTLAMYNNGSKALRINNDDNSFHTSSATQTAIIPSLATPTLKFAWAAVLEDPGHDLANQPFVEVQVYDETAKTYILHQHYVSGIPSFGGWARLSNSNGTPVSPSGTPWNVIPWQTVNLDVSSAVGHSVTVRVIASDCGYGGHGGYAYLDDAP
jgi:hypothetical protein